MRRFLSQNHRSNRAEVIDNVRSWYFWRAIFAEFVGTFFMLTLSCGASLPLARTNSMRPFEAAACTGLIMMTLIWCLGHVSGAHFNPAISIAHLVARRMSILRCLLYIVVQLIGATMGELTLTAFIGQDQSTMTMLDPHTDLGAGQAFLVEFLATHVFAMTIFISCYDERAGFTATKPMMIGGSLAAAIMFSAQMTGGALNSARAFGPCVVSGKWAKHWIYWLGPCFGSISAALIFELLWHSHASKSRLKAFLSSRDYDPDGFEDRSGKGVRMSGKTANMLRTPAVSTPAVTVQAPEESKRSVDSETESESEIIPSKA